MNAVEMNVCSVVNETVQLKSEFCDCTKIPDPTGQARKPVALELGLFITFEGKEVTLVLYDCCQAS